MHGGHFAPTHSEGSGVSHGEHLFFIELLGSANAAQTVDTLKAMKMKNCKFAFVALSDEKIVAQLDWMNSSDGDEAILNQIAKVDGVVQTNIIAVVRPRKG